jgi:hypothetical protein
VTNGAVAWRIKALSSPVEHEAWVAGKAMDLPRFVFSPEVFAQVGTQTLALLEVRPKTKTPNAPNAAPSRLQKYPAFSVRPSQCC